MTNEITKQCKSKNCENNVVEGRYCNNCIQRKKEKKEKIFGLIGSTAVVGVFVAVKKGVIKKVPSIASKIVGAIFHI